MGFAKVERVKRSYVKIQEIRYSVKVASGDSASTAGVLKMPPSIVQALGWAEGAVLEVHVGSDEDTGWFLVKPAEGETKMRSKLKIKESGVGEFVSSVLVPPGTTAALPTRSPEARIDGNELYLKLAA